MAYQDLPPNHESTHHEAHKPTNPGPVVRILGLCGSVRDGAYSLRALNFALEAAKQAGAQCQSWPQAQMHLPLCDGIQTNDAVLKLREAVQRSDALILATPEYCGTMSAVMKNAIEWIGYDLLVQKPVGIIAVAAGSSADGSLNALRQLALVQGMWVLPATAPVPLAERVFHTLEQLQSNEATNQANPSGSLTAENPASTDEFSHIVLQHLSALGQALPEAVRRLNTPSTAAQSSDQSTVSA
jgi:NAD(P)H-dependent FMN reductase